MSKFKEYYKQSRAELDNVIFPTREQTRNAYFAVAIVVIVIALFLALVDLIMSSIIAI